HDHEDRDGDEDDQAVDEKGHEAPAGIGQVEAEVVTHARLDVEELLVLAARAVRHAVDLDQAVAAEGLAAAAALTQSFDDVPVVAAVKGHFHGGIPDSAPVYDTRRGHHVVQSRPLLSEECGQVVDDAEAAHEHVTDDGAPPGLPGGDVAAVHAHDL